MKIILEILVIFLFMVLYLPQNTVTCLIDKNAMHCIFKMPNKS